MEFDYFYGPEDAEQYQFYRIPKLLITSERFKDVSVESKLLYAFVILASASGTLAGRPGAEELLKEALEVYDRFFWNEEEGLACDTWNTEFTVLDDYRGLNANMHTVEAFLAAADVTGNEKYRERAGRIIDHVLGWASNNNWRIPEHFTKDWTPDLECNKDRPDDPFKPYGATPGHGIEWSRLITQWAVSTYGEKNEKAAGYLQAAENLFNRAIGDGWNADGAPGIVYTTDWDGKPVVYDRMHWTLAEAINTSAVLYRMGDRKEHVPEKPEVTFTIKRAVEADVPEINAIMQEAASDQTHPDWFVSSDINYIRRNLSECGITAIARTAEGEAAGFFIIELPEGGVDELADFLGFTEEQKQHTGIMDTAVVTRRFRGYGLQGRMLAFCEEELKDRELWYYLTTIHPDNKYSLANMQGGGFEIAKRVVCYGGKDRYILVKDRRKKE